MPSDLDVALEAAHAGAAVIRDAFGKANSPTFKTSAVDPVTATDHAAEAAILEVLGSRRPDDVTLSEESGGAGWDGERVWIADPLDGTVNFVHGLPHVAVSVALWDMGEPVAGVVIDVTRDEIFTAETGGGAFLDGRPVHVSAESHLRRCLAVTGFPYDRTERAEVYGSVFTRVLASVQGIRRTGSAALDMCYIGCGRFDVYWELGVKPWDCAAALIVVNEAGGRYTSFGGRPYRLGEGGIVVTNGEVHDAMVGLVGDWA
jgi:myo-inositol-1(or 4)-monophosphatase